MNHHRRGLILRLIMAVLGFILAYESYVISAGGDFKFPSISFPRVSSSNSWSNDYDNNQDSDWGWDSSDSGWDSDWDSGGGGWDYGGGDSGSWDSGGGDSGSW